MKNTITYIFLIMLWFANANALEKGDRENGDFNFDGEPDYRIFIMPNGRSQVWEYHLKVLGKKSYKITTLDLANPKFSLKTKRVYTYHSGGHVGLIFVADTYSWRDYEAHLEKSVVQRYDPVSERYVIAEINNIGKRPIVEKLSVITEEQARRNAVQYASSDR